MERKLSITGHFVSKGKLFTEMENMPGLDPMGERFMRSDDVKRMSQEVSSSVVAEATTDYGYVPREGMS